MRLSRRALLNMLPAQAALQAQRNAIDRRALARRHNPVLTSFNPRSPLSVGNGEIAFTADVTGLQTFPELYEKAMPLCTQSQWGWHSFAPLRGLGAADLKLTMFDTHGRAVGYPVSADGQRELYNWLRENPHRLHLGRIGLRLMMNGGRAARPEDLSEIRQELDLFSGVLESRFTLEGVEVAVRTCCHPGADAIGIQVRSALCASGRLAVAIDFPYGSPEMHAADWARPEAHTTTVAAQSARSLDLWRELDSDSYFTRLTWSPAAKAERKGPHSFLLRPDRDDLRLTVAFAEKRQAASPSRDAFEASRAHWSGFWTQGGAVDLSETPSPEARELERRIVLSQYLTVIQCSGSRPPQETGLTCNSWYGKYHLEMHWWHAYHFPLWGRTHLLERSLAWYEAILPSARAWAKAQGYAGARWPKMTATDGRDSPSPIGPLLIWQQPHIISFAELCFRSRPDRATLDRYATLVFESAEFMASYAVERGGRFTLGPPVIPAQENHPPRETWNPTYELEYWHYALGVAQQWRRRMNLAPSGRWERVRANLATLPVREGVYLAHENCPQTYTERNRDHPSMLAALGVLPGAMADRETMRRTLHKVLASWRWPDTWGWDYPMVAMTATRLDEPDAAVRALLMDTPKNEYLPNGHNYQRANLPLYLPGNGGLLAAIALMAAGWSGHGAPRFPKGWAVRSEGLTGFPG